MNYEKQYAMMIELRKDREPDPGEYYERHHIWPKSLGGPDENWNIIYLTAKEHLIAHELLYKMCEGEDRFKMGNAFLKMCCISGNQKREFTARQYERARKASSEVMSGRFTGENNPMYGRTGENHPSYGKERPKMMGKNNPFYGKTHSEESKKKMSESKKSESQERITCPHCGKTGIKSNMKRWHFDNCGKYKPQKKVTCPHCGKTGGITNMKKYHFDNCGKINPNKDKSLERVQCPHCGEIGAKNAMTRWHFDNCGKTQKEVQCPHCGKVGKEAGMKRHHFNNCKYKE